jgi:hypothetical protein
MKIATILLIIKHMFRVGQINFKDLKTERIDSPQLIWFSLGLISFFNSFLDFKFERLSKMMPD